MRIIIIGAGKVGYQIAATLSKELYDVVIIDQDEQVISKVNENLDVYTICSNGLVAQPLKELGVNGTDVVIAVTDSDEGNMLACISAKHLGAGRTIARIRNPEYAKDLAVTTEQLSIDYVINPEKSTAFEISRLLTFSPAGQVGDFAKGKVQMVAIQIDDSNPLIKDHIKVLKVFGSILIAAIIRKGKIIIPKGNDLINVNDTIYIIGKKTDILKFCKSIGKSPGKTNNVMIVGGGRNAYYLAENLHYLGISVKVIEKDLNRCRELSEKLPNTLIINGDGTDSDMLKSENIESMDAFVALTGVDEENILISLLAKQLGVSKVISKISRTNYISLVETIGVDAAISPSMITASEILKFIRGGKIISLFLLLGGQAEIMELIAHPHCKAINIPIKNLGFPKDAIMTTIVNNNKVIVPHGNDVIKPNDRIIILSLSSEVARVRSLFTENQGENKHGLWNYFKGSRPTAPN